MPTRTGAPESGLRDNLPTLDGPRIALRGFREDDLPDFYAMHSDPAVNRYWSFPAWTELSQAYDYFASAIGGRDASRLLCWAIAERADDRLVGAITLHGINRAQGRAEIGFALRASHWGRGYAGEAMPRVLDHAFAGLELRRIEADTDPRNAGACTLLERMGFVREGLLRERWQVGGEISDSALYGLLASDWRRRRCPPTRPPSGRRSGFSRDGCR